MLSVLRRVCHEHDQGLADCEEAKDHNDQVHTGLQTILAEGVALGLGPGLNPDRLQRNAKAGEHVGGQNMTTLGYDDQQNALSGREEYLTGAKSRRDLASTGAKSIRAQIEKNAPKKLAEQAMQRARRASPVRSWVSRHRW